MNIEVGDVFCSLKYGLNVFYIKKIQKPTKTNNLIIFTLKNGKDNKKFEFWDENTFFDFLNSVHGKLIKVKK